MMHPADLAAVARLDREATGFARRPMLDRLVAAGEGLVLLRDGAPAGYAVSRPFGRGHVVGPVVAGGRDEACRLIAAALAPLDGRFVRVDAPDAARLSPWLAGIGLPKVGDALTMVRGGLPPTGRRASSRWPTSRSTDRSGPTMLLISLLLHHCRRRSGGRSGTGRSRPTR